tara:strand:+ start:22 stop:492 length:471 start_codon:yes stop_codon:yes gene_type:complete
MRKVLIAVGLVFFFAESQAADYRLGSIGIESPWARATASPQQPGAVFMSIENRSDITDHLTAIACTGAGTAEIHETKVERDMAHMHSVRSVEIAPGERVELMPGGKHVMLMGLTNTLKQGRTLRCSLTFQRNGTADVVVQILSAGAMGHTKRRDSM